MAKNLEIKKIHDILINSKLFKLHPSQLSIEDVDFEPHHLCCIDERIVIYLNHKNFYENLNAIIIIMDWSLKKRPIISFEEFLEFTTTKVKEELLFYIDLFNQYSVK